VTGLDPGSEFAGHRIEGLIGRGGMGEVYRALHVGLDRTVALKVVAPMLAEEQAVHERFRRECRLAASLDHPAAIPIYEAGEHDGRLCVTMRLVQGPDLGRQVRGAGPLAPEWAAELAARVAEALDAAHARGLVHRDVKPANLLLESAGQDCACSSATSGSPSSWTTPPARHGPAPGWAPSTTPRPRRWPASRRAHRPTSTPSAACSTRR
jgi:serine/threonine protein kinase